MDGAPVAATTVPTPPDLAPLPIPARDPTPPVPPPGPGAVAYEFGDIQGHAYAGVLMHATLLTGVTGMEPDRAVDLLTLRTLPAQDCYPRAHGGFPPLDAIWLLEPFPQTEGTFAFDGGPMPGELSAKTWLWDGTTGSTSSVCHVPRTARNVPRGSGACTPARDIAASSRAFVLPRRRSARRTRPIGAPVRVKGCRRPVCVPFARSRDVALDSVSNARPYVSMNSETLRARN